MRIVDPSVTAGMQETREIAGRLTLRDTRLRFTSVLGATGDDAAVANGLSQIDASVYNNGIMRIAFDSAANKVYAQYISAPIPKAAAWPSWVELTGLTDMNVLPSLSQARPALIGNRIFYLYYDQTIRYRDITPDGQGGFTLSAYTSLGLSTYHCQVGTLTALSETEAYISYWSNVGFYQNNLDYINASGAKLWHGRIYLEQEGPHGWFNSISAVRLNGADYVFFDSNNKGSIRYVKRVGGCWSDSQPLIPMDVFDETAKFVLGGASIIDGKVVVSGLLKRPSGIAMHVYFIGPDHFTAGRDFFIMEAGASDAWGGKLLPVGDEIWYIGNGLRAWAPATEWMGVDAADRKLATSNFSSLRIASQGRAPAQLSAQLAFGIESELPANLKLDPGVEVEVEAAYNGSYAKLGTFEIDSVTETDDQTGGSKTLMARSKAMKRLAQWQSDSDFDYWSQAKLVTSSIDEGKLVRTAGKWKQVDDYFINDQINKDGVLYGTSRASRGMSVKARFYNPAAKSSAWLPEFGVILNYYRENRAEAAARLGKDAQDVDENEYGHNGIYVLCDGANIRVYSVVNNTRTEITNAAYTPQAASWFQLWAILQDGNLRVYIKSDSSTVWSRYIDYALFSTDYRPPANLGRGAIYTHNGTNYTTTPGFGSASPVVPVDDISVFPDATGHIQVDNEIIYYDSRKTVTDTNDKALREMTLFPEGCEVEGATFFNPYWPVNTYVDMDGKTQLWLEPAGATYDKTTYSGFALACTEGTNKGDAYKIYWYDYQAPAQWRPTKTYPLPDTWQDHVGESGAGVWYGPAIRRIVVWGFPPPGDSDTRYVLYDTLTCGSDYTVPDPVGRGEMGTTPSSHAPGAKVYRYTTNRIRCKDVEIVSTDLDISLQDMVTELARKAGVLDVRTEAEVESPLATGYTGSGHYFFEPRTRHGSSIVRIKIPAAGEVGIRVGGAVTGAPMVGVDKNGLVSFYAYDPALSYDTLIERVATSLSATGCWVTFSAAEGVISVWINDRLVASFADTHATYLQEVALLVYGNTSIEVDWPVLDTRVDNFILDMGKRGTQLLERLIGEKRVFYQDDADGALHCFRRRKAVNAGSPYPLSVADGRTHTDAELVTRVRLDGAEAYEAVDWDQLREYGNLFGLFNMRELLLMAEFQQEAADILDDAAGNAHRTTLAGAADPRVEPEDILSVTLPDGTKDVIVRGVSFNLMQGEREALFDMEIEARDV